MILSLILGGLLWSLGLEPQTQPQQPAPAPTATSTETVLGIQLDQESNGIPGRESEEKTLQRIYFAPDRMRLEDLQSGITYIFRLDQDPAAVWELSADRKYYRNGKDLGKIQVDRDRFERQVIETLKGQPESERAEHLRNNHLRLDGSRVVTAKSEAGLELLGHKTVRHQVEENGRVVVDALLCEDFGVQIPFFEFYKRVGAFSGDVLAELQKLRGIPLQARLTVVTAGLTYPIEARVTRIEKKALDLSLFELPEGAEELIESPFVPCAWCSREVEKAAPGAKYIRNGETIYFFSKECRAAWQKRRLEGGRKQKPETPKATERKPK